MPNDANICNWHLVISPAADALLDTVHFFFLVEIQVHVERILKLEKLNK